MRRLSGSKPDEDPANTEDAFAALAPDPIEPEAAAAKHDWLAEFPDESAPGGSKPERSHLLSISNEKDVTGKR